MRFIVVSPRVLPRVGEVRMIVSWFVLRVPTSRSNCDDAWVRVKTSKRKTRQAHDPVRFIQALFRTTREAPPCSGTFAKEHTGGAHKKTMFTVPSRAV